MSNGNTDIKIGNNWGCLSISLGIFILWNMERILNILEALAK